MKLAQGIAHQTELISRRFELVAISPGQRRPGFRSCRDPLAGLNQHCRIKAAKAPGFIVHRDVALQSERCAHSTQTGNLLTVRRLGLRTEKQQILNQTVCNACVAPCQRGVLHENARSDPLGIHVRREQPPAERLEKTGANLPERTRLTVSLPGHEAERQVAQLPSGIEISILDNLQHRLIKARTGSWTIVERLRRDFNVRLTKAPLYRPQVRGMDAISSCQRLDVPVLRKQSHG